MFEFGAEFWVGIAFLIFWGILFYYGVPARMLGSLDNRGRRIADELAEAKRLRTEAEALLKQFEAKRTAAEQEAAEIVSNARDEADPKAGKSVGQQLGIAETARDHHHQHAAERRKAGGRHRHRQREPER